ncbi:Abhydrolase incomplete domain containing protein [Pandoravirus neocaledonia]|uniref:Abhydrolase incomplete domain containing protein n=1 Tax=Pandoravirus neocaledonia TaxID=2107708 RepID=A0A2U7UD52_9VIRU|nr:Abhydrolase incomplete domain containing protein [Pandoravirus neocaledonia]AVK76398.1 Abhydrolase incomplete domain containing protein [Pandoravirus neocaledonia]
MELWEEMITPSETRHNPFDGATYCVSYETLMSLRPQCVSGVHDDQYGRTATEYLDENRIVLVHTPHRLLSADSTSAPLVFFFHGLGSHPWKVALHGTGWRRMAHDYGFIVAFAVGTDCGSQSDKRCGFRVRDSERDIAYVRAAIDRVRKIRSVDATRIYGVGHSNGAIFSSVLAQRLGGSVFAAMVNVMGGFGKNGQEVLPVAADKPLPLLFVTGTHDAYKEGCECAHRFFAARGYASSIRVLDGVEHKYPRGDEEERMWSFLAAHTRP